MDLVVPAGELGVGLFCLGLIVGSFLNVVIYRLPLMIEHEQREICCEILEIPHEPQQAPLTLSKPNSHCPHCKTAIKPWQNIPVLSYVLLGGKCSHCKVLISPRYPAVELFTGLMTLALLWVFPLSPALLGAALLTWSLIALTMIDLDHQLLPDNITLPLMWLGLLFNLKGTYIDLADAVIGAMAGYLILWMVYWGYRLLTGKHGMGGGDFKLLAALGAWLGWQMLPEIILLSSLVGAISGIALMFIKRRGREIPIPFGPYLAMAGWLALVWGNGSYGSVFARFGLHVI